MFKLLKINENEKSKEQPEKITHGIESRKDKNDNELPRRGNASQQPVELHV